MNNRTKQSVLATAFAAAVAATPALAQGSGVEGYWLTEKTAWGQAVIEVTGCDHEGKPSICGKIYATADLETAKENEGRADKCDQQILWGFSQDGNEWVDGKIHHIVWDKTFDAKVRLDSDNSDVMKLKGYLGVSLFGQTQDWQRVNPANYTPCLDLIKQHKP